MTMPVGESVLKRAGITTIGGESNGSADLVSSVSIVDIELWLRRMASNISSQFACAEAGAGFISRTPSSSLSEYPFKAAAVIAA